MINTILRWLSVLCEGFIQILKIVSASKLKSEGREGKKKQWYFFSVSFIYLLILWACVGMCVFVCGLDDLWPNGIFVKHRLMPILIFCLRRNKGFFSEAKLLLLFSEEMYSCACYFLAKGKRCSSHRPISFRESMPLLRESVTHWPTNWQSALIPSPSQELFFWSLFCRTDNVRESLELAEETYLSHMTALIPLGTLRSLLVLNTLPTNQGPAYRPATQRDTFSLSLLHACY